MQTDSKEHIKKMKVFPKGQVVLPVSIRKKYQIEIGDQVEVISVSEGILLKPVPKKQSNTSLTRRLFGIFGDYAKGHLKLHKKDIDKATEEGFMEGWTK